MQPLVDAGGEVVYFQPLTLFAVRPTINFRNHRKIVVVDGCTGFLGGINIGDEYKTDWHDLAMQLEGPAVDQLQETFAEDWFYATGREIVAPQIFCKWHSPEALAKLPAVDDPAAVCSILASGPHTPHNITHDALFLSLTQARAGVHHHALFDSGRKHDGGLAHGGVPGRGRAGFGAGRKRCVDCAVGGAIVFSRFAGGGHSGVRVFADACCMPRAC